MKAEQIEALLRTRPADEPDRDFRPLLDSRAADASPTHRVRPIAGASAGIGWAAVLVVAIGLTIGAVVFRNGTAGPSPSPTSSSPEPSAALGVIPWIDATPGPTATPEATPDPETLPGCAPDDLALVAGGWGGATGSMAGGATLINTSGQPCRIWDQLPSQLSDATGAVVARVNPSIAVGGSGVRAIPAGGDVTGLVVWMNWCGAAPKLPLTLTLYLPDRPETTVSVDTPSISAPVRDEAGGAGSPRCDEPGSPSSVGAASFDPPEPSVGGYTPQPCEASALTAFSSQWGAGMGSDYAILVVFNAGSFDCILPTSPTIELRDAGGALLASSVPWPDSPATVVLPAGWTADARLFFNDWCAAPPTLPLRLDLVVAPGAVRPIVHAASADAEILVPFCNSAPATPPPGFGYDAPFTVPGAAIAPPPDPVDSLPLRVTLSALPAAAPGSVLSYTVTLTNVSEFGKPLNLAFLCPTYVQRLSLPGGASPPDVVRMLNCEPIGTLAGGASVSLEMHLAIPSDAPTGTAAIVWQLGQRGSAAKAEFQIQR